MNASLIKRKKKNGTNWMEGVVAGRIPKRIWTYICKTRGKPTRWRNYLHPGVETGPQAKVSKFIMVIMMNV